MRLNSLLALGAAGLLCLQAGAASAATGTVSATIPWQGKGQVFRIGPQSLIFLGSIKGIVYAESDDGLLDEGLMICPLTQRLDTATQSASAVGQCEIVVDQEDVIYAEFVCEGKLGSCTGEFRLTGGGGRFAGISGSSKLRVRSPLHVLAVDVASGSQLRLATGLAQLPELKYQFPD